MKKALITLFAMGMLYACLGLCASAESESNMDISSTTDAAVMTVDETLPAETYTVPTTGWEQDSEGNWYYYVDGELVTEQIMKIGDAYYYFDWEGVMCTGTFWQWDSDAQESYLMMALPSGEVLVDKTGWHQSGEDWYYFKSAGHLANNEIMTIGDNGYYFEGDGKMAVSCGWGIYDENDNFIEIYATESGALACGWYETEWNELRYYDPVEYYLYMDVIFTNPAAYSAKSAHPFRKNGAPFRFKLSTAQFAN